jgi:hypothetical protein
VDWMLLMLSGREALRAAKVLLQRILILLTPCTEEGDTIVVYSTRGRQPAAKLRAVLYGV